MRESTRNEESRGVEEEAGGARGGLGVGKPLAADGGNENPAREMEASLEEVLERANMQQALKRVQGNQGAPGVDGMTVEQLAGYLRGNWTRIRQELLEDRYRPSPVRRVKIPKEGGERELGIPTVVDRLIQQAILQVLQGKW